MHASALFGIEDLFAAVAEGYVRVNKHPELPLSLYVYTEKAQFSNVWTPVTRQCRGLVLENETFEVVSLPLEKFFNSNQHGGWSLRDGSLELNEWAPPLPDEPFEIFEKVDGSMISVFCYQGQWLVASKGSFTSDQARWAWELLDGKTEYLAEGWTYISELIHEDNRIVIDYGDRRDLVLLAIRSCFTGREVQLPGPVNWNHIGSVVRTHTLGAMVSSGFLKDLEKFASEGKDLNGVPRTGIEAEGYVIRYVSGLRAKVKLADYLQAHKLFTQTNERTVHGWLSTGQELSGILALVPDEYAEWVKGVAAGFTESHDRLVDAVWAEFGMINRNLGGEVDQKTFALAAVKSPWKSALFMLRAGDGDKLDAWAWKQIRPFGKTTFRKIEEEITGE